MAIVSAELSGKLPLIKQRGQVVPLLAVVRSAHPGDLNECPTIEQMNNLFRGQGVDLTKLSQDSQDVLRLQGCAEAMNPETAVMLMQAGIKPLSQDAAARFQELLQNGVKNLKLSPRYARS